MERTNIILIGMPGAGKSTLGVLLAKTLSFDFVDTDVLIQTREGRSLQHIIDADGLEAFCDLEARHITSLACARTVVATGGSVVYRDAAMTHLRGLGVIVFLDLPQTAIAQRVSNIATRGIVKAPGQSLGELYAQRHPLYRRWAEVTIACQDHSHEGVLAEILLALANRR